MKILYLTRKYPPMKGGMEKVNFLLSSNLKKYANVELIFWNKSQKWIPFIFFYFLIKSFWILLTKKIDVIHLGDGLLSPLGLLLKKAFRVPVTVTIHGLDIIWRFWFYQILVPQCLARLDRIICVSTPTKEECLKRGVMKKKTVIISNGIETSEFHLYKDKRELKSILSDEFGISLQDKEILLSVGRLVERKGFAWFISQVLPPILKLRKDVLYLIVGEGRARDRIENEIRKNNLVGKVLLLGEVKDETLKMLYNASDLFIMPNISVRGDMEGFGLVALEASSVGLPVIASKSEGIKDALKNIGDDFFLKPYDSEGFVKAISKLLKDDNKRKEVGARMQKSVLKNYSWGEITRLYLKEFKKVIRKTV